MCGVSVLYHSMQDRLSNYFDYRRHLLQRSGFVFSPGISKIMSGVDLFDVPGDIGFGTLWKPDAPDETNPWKAIDIPIHAYKRFRPAMTCDYTDWTAQT